MNTTKLQKKFKIDRQRPTMTTDSKADEQLASAGTGENLSRVSISDSSEAFGLNGTQSVVSPVSYDPVAPVGFQGALLRPYSITILPVKEKHLTKPTKVGDFYYEKPLPQNDVLELPLAEREAVRPYANAPARCSVGGYMALMCKNGHLIRKQMGCNKEYCTVCGDKWGLLHQQRYFRGIRKVEYIYSLKNNVGYFVLELPKEFREVIAKKQLSQLQTFVTKYFQRKGFSFGVSAWHWCGEDGQTFKPHLNILLSAGFMDQKTIADIRKAWTREVKKLMPKKARSKWISRMKKGNKSATCTVNYSFTKDITGKGNARFKWRYVCRPTWRVYSDEIKDIVFNFRNIRWWGDFKNKMEENATEKVDKCKCPVCSEPLYSPEKFGFTQDINEIDYIHLGGGVFLWKFIAPVGWREIRQPVA